MTIDPLLAAAPEGWGPVTEPAALSAPEPAAQPEDSRCPPTYRREEAVKALIGMGWMWDGEAWVEPAAQGEAVLYVEARQCDNCNHIGLNDASETEGACHDCDWHGPEPAEDMCPGCGHKNCMAAACPICGNRYSFLTDRRFNAQPAQPAERVPEITEGHVRVFLDCQDADPADGEESQVYHGLMAVRDAMLAASPAPSESEGGKGVEG